MENVFLGHGADWWNSAMLLSLGLAALVALLVAVATTGAVISAKRETIAAQNELERYKADSAERAASLEKVAEEAKLETARIKKEVAWRTLPPAIAEKLTAELSKHPSTATLMYVSGDPETMSYCWQFVRVFRKAGWKTEFAGRHFFMPPVGIWVMSNDVVDIAPEARSDIEWARKAFSDAGLRTEQGFGVIATNNPFMDFGVATANVRVIFGHKPSPQLE